MCTALPKGLIPAFHQHPNGTNKHLQFTRKKEENGNLALLDLLLKCNHAGSVDTTVHRKKTHTDKYLDLTSHPTLVHKQSVVSTLFEGAKKLSSDAVSRAEEEVCIRRALKMNEYPRSFIIHTVRRSSGKCQEKINEGECGGKPKTTVTLPYVRGVSENIKRMLEKASVRVRMKPHRTFRQMLIKPEDPTLNHHQIGVVYRVPCSDYPQAYIGQSGCK